MSTKLPDQEKITCNEDAGIQAEAWMALWKADHLRSLDINSLDLKVQDGDIWLIGHVKNSHHRQLAENLLRTVRDVHGVHNQLVVDSDLVIEVAHALAAEAQTRPYIIPVGAHYGWIHLGGEVPSQEVRSAAEQVAASVPTVRGVITLPHLPGEKGNTRLDRRNRNCHIQPQIGDQVYAQDGLAGRVAAVVINPRNRLVTHISVAADFEVKGHFVGGEFLVPADAVRTATEGNLFLTGSLRELALRPAFDDADYPPAPPAWRPPYPYRRGAVCWLVEAVYTMRNPRRRADEIDRSPA